VEHFIFCAYVFSGYFIDRLHCLLLLLLSTHLFLRIAKDKLSDPLADLIT
jgi:hypothetical protein